MSDPKTDSPRAIDMHVHMVSNGSSGSGGWLRLKGWHRWLGGFMVRQLGLSADVLEGDLDRLYADRVRELVATSSFDSAVLLAHEQVYDPDGKVRTDLGSMYVPNDVVLRLAAQHPEFLAGVSIHPARRDALEELERCVEQGAVLMKCLPNCQNIDFREWSYEPFWKRMAELRLPLLAHTGGEHTVPVVNAELADPRHLRFPLKQGVTVIAAHCGTSSGLFDHDYFEEWCGMLREFPHFYGDNSALVSLNRCAHVRECASVELESRVLHGSDFPVPALGHRLRLHGWINGETFHRVKKVANPLERDWQFKVALGFPEESRTRVTNILRMPKSSS